MHRLILGLTDPKIQVDHRNGNGLDNRRENIRVVTASQNQMNASKTKRPKVSKFKGVTRNLRRPGCYMWKALITMNNKTIFLGEYKHEREAARAYNEAARRLFGDYARLNELS